MKTILVSISLLLVFSLGFDSQKVGLNLGDVAPEIVQNGVDGKPVKLSDLRGKMVLVDFWASWCRPCRMANPQVVKTYKEYKDKKFKSGDGFTVFSVSLDTDKNRWLNAIQEDGLEWDYHTCDFKGWQNSMAARYRVRAIPATFLLDGNGVIIGKNLHASELQYELAKRSVK